MGTVSRTKMRRSSSLPIKRRRFVLRRSSRQLMTVVIVVAVAIALGSWLVGKVIRPIMLVSNEQRERDSVVTEYKTLSKENDELRRQLRYLQTPRGIEHEARKHGFVMPGEVTLVIPEKQTQSSE